jgi:hypothetical protein
MTNQLIKLLNKESIQVIDFTIDNWGDVDDDITLKNGYSIQVGASYLCLCKEIENGIQYLKEVSLNKINNTAQIKGFIEFTKTEIGDI